MLALRPQPASDDVIEYIKCQPRIGQQSMFINYGSGRTQLDNVARFGYAVGRADLGYRSCICKKSTLRKAYNLCIYIYIHLSEISCCFSCHARLLEITATDLVRTNGFNDEPGHNELT